MKLAILGAAGAALLTAGPACAGGNGPGLLYRALGSPEGWTIRGSLRSRIEGIDGQYRPRVDERDQLLSFRSLIFVEHDAGPVRIGAELQDGRGYLERANSSVGVGDVNTLELIQAYVGVDLQGGAGRNTTSALTLGRFTQNIGSQRLVGKNELFPNTQNAITGVAFDWSNAAHDSARLFWGMPNTRLPSDRAGIHSNRVQWDRQTLDLQFFGGSFTKAGVLGGTMEIYAYGLLERDAPNAPTRNRRLFTPGIRFARNPRRGAFDQDIEIAYQTGRARATAAASDVRDLDVSAWLVHLGVGRTFSLRGTPHLSVSFDYASGDRGDPGSYNRFDALYGIRRLELGPTGLYGAIHRANLISPELRLEVAPAKRWDSLLAWRALWLDTVKDGFSGFDIRDATGARGRFAGHQIEGRVRYWVIPGTLRFDTGFAWLAKSRLLRDAPNVGNRHDTRYGYADMTFGF